jgi:hypothetical protein
MNIVKREKWTEIDIDALPLGEHDYFERKSGQLFNKNKGEFLDDVAKAISALANSGGGHLLLGVNNDGIPDGMPPKEGKTSIKDWLEQKIPYLVDYSLSDFRVHLVLRSDPSRIPPDREVVVVDVGDSTLAPHQSSRDKTYYHRRAGRSERAPHFYLELLRQRLVNPVLDLALIKVKPIDAAPAEDGVFLETKLIFAISNNSRVAAYKWALLIKNFREEIDNSGEELFYERRSDYRFGIQNYPIKGLRQSTIRMDDTILPGCEIHESKDVGFLLRPSTLTSEAVKAEINQMILSISLGCQLATETSPGELKEIELGSVANADELTNFVIQHTTPSAS